VAWRGGRQRDQPLPGRAGNNWLHSVIDAPNRLPGRPGCYQRHRWTLDQTGSGRAN
jgi:hypothetical protein